MLVSSASGTTLSGTVNITSVAPGLFAANADGQGVAAALVQRNLADGQVSYEPVARFDAALNKQVPLPVELGPESDQVFLLLYGTGFRFRSSLVKVSATVGGETAPVLYASVAPGYIGLDQVNLRLARSLMGRGEVDVIFTVDGKTAPPVKIAIR